MRAFMVLWMAIFIPFDAARAAINFSSGHPVLGMLNVSAAVLILTFFVLSEY